LNQKSNNVLNIQNFDPNIQISAVCTLISGQEGGNSGQVAIIAKTLQQKLAWSIMAKVVKNLHQKFALNNTKTCKWF